MISEQTSEAAYQTCENTLQGEREQRIMPKPNIPTHMSQANEPTPTILRERVPAKESSQCVCKVKVRVTLSSLVLKQHVHLFSLAWSNIVIIPLSVYVFFPNYESPCGMSRGSYCLPKQPVACVGGCRARVPRGCGTPGSPGLPSLVPRPKSELHIQKSKIQKSNKNHWNC